MGQTITVIEERDGHHSIQGRIERLYWRGEELWVRMRSGDGRCLSVNWQQSDLPPVIIPAVPDVPRLSPLGLLALVRHLSGCDASPPPARRKASLD